MITSLIILSSIVLLSMIFLAILFSKNMDLRDSNIKMKNSLAKLNGKKLEQNSKLIGMKALRPDYGLVYYHDDKEDDSFKVTYEFEILEVGEKNVRVKSLDFTSNDKIANEKSNRKGILDFLDGKWISLNELDIISDEASRRNSKLEQLGIK